jgi:signal transduction histidine kinase
MSLTTRITLLICLLLAICGLSAGIGFHHILRRSAETALQSRLDARLGWLEAALDVDMDDGQIQLDSIADPPEAAETWEVATVDGRVLWSELNAKADANFNSAADPAYQPASDPPGSKFSDMAIRSRTLSFGRVDGVVITGELLQPDEGPGGGRTRQLWVPVTLAEVPVPVLDAAQNAVKKISFQSAWRRIRSKKKDQEEKGVFELHGTAGEKKYDLRLDAGGKILRIKDRKANPYVEYHMPEGAQRLQLTISARTSTKAMKAELARMARLLWILGPAVLLLTAGLLAALIRWQLRPLSRIARQASLIGPNNPETIIHTSDTSTEVMQLRQSINSMLTRLNDALNRERRFASMAAHELRTPLAQMRLTLDVILRRKREAAEYREALEDLSADVERLQKLVLGLLQLARSPEQIAAQARSVSVASILDPVLQYHRSVHYSHKKTEESLWVHGDVELLQGALRNVLENAVRYAPCEPPSIFIHPTDKNNIVQIMVSDRGPGVAESERERIFQPLARLEQSNGSPSNGLGLGLAIARTAVRALGGDLICRSRSDGKTGAEFVFTLRRVQPPLVDFHPH